MLQICLIIDYFKIDEPKTPYHNYSDSEGEELSSGGGTRPRRVSLVGAVDADELRKGISEGVKEQLNVLDPPGCGGDDEDSETGLTEEQLGGWSPELVGIATH